MESFSFIECVVIFIVAVIVMGPTRLPEAMRKIGRIMGAVRQASDEFKKQLMSMDETVKEQLDTFQNPDNFDPELDLDESEQEPADATDEHEPHTDSIDEEPGAPLGPEAYEPIQEDDPFARVNVHEQELEATSEGFPSTDSVVSQAARKAAQDADQTPPTPETTPSQPSKVNHG